MSKNKKWILIGIASVVALVCIAIALSIYGCHKRDSYVRQGIEALQENQYKEARQAFSDALKLPGFYGSYEYVTIRMYHGEASLGLGNFETAIADFDLAEELLLQLLREECAWDVEDVLGELYRMRGIAKLYHKEFQEAQADLTKAQSEYGMKDCEYYMGVLACERGEYEQALAILIEAAATYPEHTAADYYIAVCYEFLGDFKAACSHMEAYLMVHPEDAHAQREYAFLKTR